MIICISGLTGSGKNTVGELVAKKLSLRLVNPTFKTIAEEKGISLLQLQKVASESYKIDKEFDAALKREAKKGNCVVTTWLGPWMIKADLKVWLDASEKERAKRIAGRDKISLSEAKKHIKERDNNNATRYKKIYGIDIYNHTGFDLIINTEKFSPEESSEIIVCAAKEVK